MGCSRALVEKTSSDTPSAVGMVATIWSSRHREGMPFEDEISAGGVAVIAYRPEWVAEAVALAADLRVSVPASLAVEHVGSTAVPGMAAKDCLDMMIVVSDLTSAAVEQHLTPRGYRRRSEPWNSYEQAGGREWPKQVYAPPVGARSGNIHVRTASSASARLALLFRDHLRASPRRTAWWSELKIAAASSTTDLHSYGRIKYPAWCLLMELAEAWANDTGWRPPHYVSGRMPG